MWSLKMLRLAPRAKESVLMPLIPTLRRRFGRKAKKWSVNVSNRSYAVRERPKRRIGKREKHNDKTDETRRQLCTSWHPNRAGPYGLRRDAACRPRWQQVGMGTSTRCRRSDRCCAGGRRERRESYRYIRFLRPPCHESNHKKSAISLS